MTHPADIKIPHFGKRIIFVYELFNDILINAKTVIWSKIQDITKL